MVGAKNQDFWPRINIIKRKKIKKILMMNVSSSKIGHNFSNKLSGSKIDTKKNVFTKNDL